MNDKLTNRKRARIVIALLLAALFGLISFNKEFLRPAFSNSEILKIVTGCFPNFIAAFLISAVAVSAVVIRKIRHGRLIVYASSIIVSTILIIEEFIPMWGASEHYDIYDVIASVVGSFLAIVTFELLTGIEKRREMKKISANYKKVEK